MAHRKAAASVWPEVNHINGYVMLLVSLSMAVRGLGFLVLTWTTVVLLGGFVSMLREEDFWCLTVITFVQIAGVVNVYADERMVSLTMSGTGLVTVSYIFARNRRSDTRGLLRVVALVKQFLGWIASRIQLMVALIVLTVSAFGFLQLGLFVAAGLSFWRLVHHDYGSTDGDPSKANMNPALSILYILVVVQCATMAYKNLLWMRGRIVDLVAEIYGFTGQELVVASVSDYYTYMMRGCSKDPTFAKGKNLITYAMVLMEPNKLREEYQSGIRILGTLLGPFAHRKPEKFHGQRRLIKQLITSSSSTRIVQKLLQMLDSRSRPYDREMRKCVARIVTLLADEICLEQFPSELQCVSSLIEAFEDWYVRDWNQKGRRQSSDSASEDYDLQEDYINLLEHGMLIFHGLASKENNCGVISKTQGLLSKIMAPVTCDLPHRTDHPTWINIVKLSLMVMGRLLDAPGETGAKVREEISSNKETVGSMERILSCDKCKDDKTLPQEVMRILTRLYIDNKDMESNFIRMLVRIFICENEDSSSRKMAAGGALALLSLHTESTARCILKADDDVLDHISKILLNVQLQNKVYRIKAAQILENLCSQYNTDDECLNKLKIVMTDVMPKVLGEIYFCGLAGDQTHTGTEPKLSDSDQGHLPETDIENQRDHQHDNNEGNNSSSHQQGEDKNRVQEFHATLLSLCVTVCDKLISTDQDLAHHLYAKAPANGVSSFPRKLRDMVEKMRHPRPNCLRMLKLTCMMVISMMKHRCSYPKQDLESLMESLSTASKDMFLLDGSMIFANSEDAKMTTKPLRSSLVSLVEEAQQLVDKYEPQEIQVLAASTPVSGNAN